MYITETNVISCWDWQRNAVSPDSVASMSNKKYYWLCPDCGASFLRVASKMLTGTGRCKKCGPEYRAKIRYANLLKMRTSVADIPELNALYAHDLNERKASEILVMSDRYAYFHCEKCGALFHRQVKNVKLGQRYCNDCAEEKRKGNYLKTRYEQHATCADCNEIMKIWDNERNDAENIFPAQLSAHSIRIVNLICPECGKRWKHYPDARVGKLPMCSACGRKIGGKSNALSALRRNGSAIDADKRIVRYWHPVKNGILSPSMVTRNSKEVCWFVCEQGHEYQMKVVDFVGRSHPCPVCKPGSHTSFAEKVIAYYLSMVVEVSENHRMSDKRMELDIYIPSLCVGIEHDGGYYHKHSSMRDERKNRLCIDEGIRLIRVKESDTNQVYGDIVRYDCNNINWQWVLDALCDLLSLHHITVDIDKDSLSIYYKVATSKTTNSIEEQRPDVARLFDVERNGNLQLSHISCCTRQSFFWYCPDCGTRWKDSAFAVTTRKYPCVVCGKKKRHRKI